MRKTPKKGSFRKISLTLFEGESRWREGWLTFSWSMIYQESCTCSVSTATTVFPHKANPSLVFQLYSTNDQPDPLEERGVPWEEEEGIILLLECPIGSHRFVNLAISKRRS
jgi:hypothetical protein